MIEALTPQVFLVGLVYATLLASLLALAISTLVLLAYRRRVLRAMNQRAVATAWPRTSARAERDPMRAGVRAADADAATRHAAWVIVAAGVGFALMFASATLLALPAFRSPGRFALMMWTFSWPIVPALLISAPLRRRSRWLLIGAPFVLWALASSALQFVDRPLDQYLTSIHPPQALGGWLLANLPPTLMWWLFSNRRLRAIGPLVLGLATALAGGGFALAMWVLLTPAGKAWLTWTAGASGASQDAILALLLATLVVASVVVGWLFMWGARRAYAAKQANDRTLALDALWLLFAVWYALLLVLGGVAWLLAAPLAFGVRRLVWRAAQRSTSPSAGVSLVFLRVFALGRRSDQLFDVVSRTWRYLAPIDLICGPDIVHSTVQPHQLMDFLTGRLASHFVIDAASLERRLQARDVRPDSDGRHRVNSFFCHADTWMHVLAALVSGPVVVLMDLRSLSARNNGCVQELHHLVDAVPLQRCVFVIDESTDREFLRATLASAWQAMAADSPNCRTTPDEISLHDLTHDDETLRGLLARLCTATQ